MILPQSQVKQAKESETDTFQLIEQEIFTPRRAQQPSDEDEEEESKMKYKVLNDFFKLIVKFKTKSLWIGISTIFILNVITTGLIYAFSSSDFIFGFYYLPLNLFFLLIWSCIKKSLMQIKKQLWINLVSFIVFGSIFFCIYFIVYHPLLHQQFQKATQCRIESYSSTIIGKSKNENYTILTMSFIDSSGKSQTGCGCLSSKSRSNILSSSPWPYSYLEKNQDIEFSTDSSTYEFSELKLPSWLCASSLESIASSSNQVIGSGSSKIDVKECYYNNYLGFNEEQQNIDQNICLTEKKFLQVIFENEPYYDKAFFHVLIALIYESFMSFSFQWPIIILSFLFSRCLRKMKEPRVNKIQKKKKEKNPRITDISIDSSFPQSESLSSPKKEKNKIKGSSKPAVESNVNLDYSQMNHSVISQISNTHKHMLRENMKRINEKQKLKPLNLSKEKSKSSSIKNKSKK